MNQHHFLLLSLAFSSEQFLTPEESNGKLYLKDSILKSSVKDIGLPEEPDFIRSYTEHKEAIEYGIEHGFIIHEEDTNRYYFSDLLMAKVQGVSTVKAVSIVGAFLVEVPGILKDGVLCPADFLEASRSQGLNTISAMLLVSLIMPFFKKTGNVSKEGLHLNEEEAKFLKDLAHFASLISNIKSEVDKESLVLDFNLN